MVYFYGLWAVEVYGRVLRAGALAVVKGGCEHLCSVYCISHPSPSFQLKSFSHLYPLCVGLLVSVTVPLFFFKPTMLLMPPPPPRFFLVPALLPHFCLISLEPVMCLFVGVDVGIVALCPSSSCHGGVGGCKAMGRGGGMQSNGSGGGMQSNGLGWGDANLAHLLP